jgi:uncharacterized protein
MNVAIIGASNKTESYAYRAFKSLIKHGHQVYMINPFIDNIDGTKIFASPSDVTESIHTLTMYVSAKHSTEMIDSIINLTPERVIFNPGSENPLLEEALDKRGINVLQACTLVLLSTNQF